MCGFAADVTSTGQDGLFQAKVRLQPDLSMGDLAGYSAAARMAASRFLKSSPFSAA